MNDKQALQVALEQHLAAAEEGNNRGLRELLQLLRTSIAAGEHADVVPFLRSAVVPTLDYSGVQSLARLRRQIRAQAPVRAPDVKLAVLSSLTSEQLTQAIDLFLFAWDLSAEIYESGYGVFRQEILDPGSGLHGFRPRILFLATCWRDLGHVPLLSDDQEAVQRAVEAEFAEWNNLWQTAHERLGCQILQNNFDAPPGARWTTTSCGIPGVSGATSA